MKFFDYIFISWFRVYRKYEKSKSSDSKFHATFTLCVCIVCFISLPFGILSRIYDLKLITGFLLHQGYFIFIIVVIGFLFLINNFYSGEKVIKINQEYEKQSQFMKQAWIWISLFLASVSITLFALIINKTI